MKNWAVVLAVELVAWAANGFHFDGYGAIMIAILLGAAVVAMEQRKTAAMLDELRKRREQK